MRFVTVEIEGEREGIVIARLHRIIEVRSNRRFRNPANGIVMHIDATDEASINHAAAKLQERLDGFKGCQGDIADYRRALELFAD